MYKSSDYSNLIYEYFFIRFQFQYYRYGEYLPSIDTLCRKFSVADKTVKSALQRLRSEGYISMHNGIATQVIFQQTKEEVNQNIFRFFSERWNYFYEGCCSFELIFIPLIVESLRCMDEQDFAYLSKLAHRAFCEDLMLIYCYTLQKLKNPLIMNLYWEISTFFGFPIIRSELNSQLYHTSLIKKAIKELISLGKSQQWELLREKLYLYHKHFIDKVISLLKPHVQINSQAAQLSFFWRIYRERPQICYSLAIQIIHEIIWEGFGTSGFLPSYQKMSDQYNVPVITVRRAVRLLNQMGAVHTINGKGTRIIPLCDTADSINFSNSAVRHNFAYFIQAAEIIFYTCEDATKTTLAALSEEEKMKLISMFDTYLQADCCECSIWRFLIFISKHHPFQGLREIYWKIYRLFLWGYPLKKAYEKISDFEYTAIEFTKSMIQSLKVNDIESCTAATKKIFHQELLLAERYLLLHGLTVEELRLLPSIQFPVKETIHVKIESEETL